MSLRTDLAKIYNLLVKGNTALTGANTFSVQRSEREIAEYLAGNGVNHRFAFPIRLLFAPANASQTAILAATNLGTAAQTIVPNVDPDFPRFLQIKGNVSGITGNVVISGYDYGDNAISDTIALSGASAVEGLKAFKEITSVLLPAQTHTPVLQKETATAAGTITLSGNASVVVTAAGMTGSPITLNVAVEVDDTAAVWAGKVRTALDSNEVIHAMFTVGGTDASITLEKKAYAANDATLNIALDNGTCTGITTAGTSANTTAGVGYDTVSIGYTNKFGLPQIMPHSGCVIFKYFNGSADGGTVTVNADLSKNIFALSGTPDGSKEVDLLYTI